MAEALIVQQRAAPLLGRVGGRSESSISQAEKTEEIRREKKD